MNARIVPNKNIEKLKSIIPAGEAMDGIEQVLNLPNDQFKEFYETMSPQIDALFETKAYQDEVMKAIQSAPLSNIEEEKAFIMELIGDLKEDETLSPEKIDFITRILEKSTLKVIELNETPRERVSVKIEKISPDAVIPSYAHPSDAGADICAIEDIEIPAGETRLIKTGLRVAIPIGYEIQVRPRSGLSLKTGLRVANAPGTIDSNYRGEIGVIMTNIGKETEKITKGMKVAQLVITTSPMIKWSEEPIDTDTDRGVGGYGSSDN